MIEEIKELHDNQHIDIDSKIVENSIFEVITGSTAYGVEGNSSDIDLFGVIIPKLSELYPSFYGKIHNFDIIKPFHNFNKTDIRVDELEYDISLMNFISYIKLVLDGNPNMVNVLFTKDSHILKKDDCLIGLIDNRQMFLQKHGYLRYTGYATSEIKKIRAGVANPDTIANEDRRRLVGKFGYDTKRGYHVVRLILQIIQILETHDLDITKDASLLSDIRQGSMTLDELDDFYSSNLNYIDRLVAHSNLQESCDKKFVKEQIENVIDSYYSSDENYNKIKKNIGW